jgi:hypothetical protein
MIIMVSTELQTSFNEAVKTYGEKVVITHRTINVGDYDEGSIYTTTGSTVGSVLFMPVSENKNGFDYQYLQQGAIDLEDFKCFVQSGVNINEADLFRMGGEYYSVLMFFDWPLEGSVIYRKAYVRRYTEAETLSGSLYETFQYNSLDEMATSGIGGNWDFNGSYLISVVPGAFRLSNDNNVNSFATVTINNNSYNEFILNCSFTLGSTGFLGFQMGSFWDSIYAYFTNYRTHFYFFDGALAYASGIGSMDFGGFVANTTHIFTLKGYGSGGSMWVAGYLDDTNMIGSPLLECQTSVPSTASGTKVMLACELGTSTTFSYLVLEW